MLLETPRLSVVLWLLDAVLLHAASLVLRWLQCIAVHVSMMFLFQKLLVAAMSNGSAVNSPSSKSICLGSALHFWLDIPCNVVSGFFECDRHQHAPAAGH
jgi:hypothetical protein